MSYCVMSACGQEPCREPCADCTAFDQRPIWARRPEYAAGMPAFLHLVADPADRHAACGAEAGTKARWQKSATGPRCTACQKIEGGNP